MRFDDISQLQEHHRAWRLLRATSAPLVLSFLGHHFIETNHGATPAGELIDLLDDHLFDIRESEPEKYLREPRDYIEEWADPERGWLRKFYPLDSDEVHYDATPAVEKAYGWVRELQGRSFVGTESRLHFLIDLLRQIVHGTETDPEVRIAELKRRRDQIDEEIRLVEADEMSMLDETGIRDRYQQFSSTARELLSDFREVEDNFRGLDRSAREKIAAWDTSKGELLEELVRSRADITQSDQGRSFQAFYDFLLSEHQRDELADLLDTVQHMPTVSPDQRLRHIHHDWADAAERTQRTVRTLSEQLRRFLEDQMWLENRRVLDIVRSVEQKAIQIRDRPPTAGVGLTIDEPEVPIKLPFDRPLYSPQPESAIDSLIEPDSGQEVELDALFAQRFVDASRLAENIRKIVPKKSNVELTEIIGFYPVEEGIAEILGYLALSDDDIEVTLSREEKASIDYNDVDGVPKRVTMPKVTVTLR